MSSVNFPSSNRDIPSVPEETTKAQNVAQKNQKGIESTSEDPSNEILRSQTVAANAANMNVIQSTMPPVYKNPPESPSKEVSALSAGGPQKEGAASLDKFVGKTEDVFLSDDPSRKQGINK